MLRLKNQPDPALCKIASGNTGGTGAHRLPALRAAGYQSVILPCQYNPRLSMLAAKNGRLPVGLSISAAFAARAAEQIAEGRVHAAPPTKTTLRF
ncbi:hypothetical protein [Brucella pituitosa]|uniref:hypothetical protein n=1 Tax=Brucella pituitosa TaxID=571256 RepID=UPI0009A15B5D|nr:hypothetical protein [Brucella pituitosa]